MGKIDYTKYPRNWKRVSAIIRRLAGGRCEWCGRKCEHLETHHLGIPWADGRPGNPHDKHDLRRENLVAICFPCHDQAEHIGAIRRNMRKQKKHRRAKVEIHRALDIGTGLVVLGNKTSSRTRPLIPFAVILKAIHFHMFAQRGRERQLQVVDSTLIYI